MCELIKLQLSHLKALIKEPLNAHLNQWLEGGHAQILVDDKDSMAGLYNGEVLIASGFTAYWTGRAHVWCVISEKSRGNFLPVFRVMKHVLVTSPYRRVEMDVPLDLNFSDSAQRRADMLGFKLECARAKHYRPSGGDSAIYAWTREF